MSRGTNGLVFGGVACTIAGLTVFPPAIAVGAVLMLKAVIVNERNLKKERSLEADHERSSAMSTNWEPDNNLPVLRNSPISFLPRLRDHDDFLSYTPPYYVPPKTSFDVDIEEILAKTKRHESDNDTERSINSNLLNSPLALEAKRLRPSLRRIESTTQTTEEERGLFGFMHVTKRVTHKSHIDFIE